MHEVHTPPPVRPVAGQQLEASLGPRPLAAAFAHLQAFLSVDAFVIVHLSLDVLPENRTCQVLVFYLMLGVLERNPNAKRKERETIR